MESEVKNKKGNNALLVIIGIVLLICSYFGGFYLGRMKAESENINNDNKILETNEIDSKENNIETKEDNSLGFNKSQLVGISPYLLENVFDDFGKKDLLKNLDSSTDNLLDDEIFRFYFAFLAGRNFSLSNEYVLDLGYSALEKIEREETGAIALPMNEYKNIYEILYGIKYTNDGILGNHSYFKYANNKIYGSSYTGYYPIIDFEITNKDITNDTIIVPIEKVNEDRENVGKLCDLKITYNTNENGTVNLTGLYLVK